MAHPVCVLKKGRERSLLNRHPWIFSGGIDRIDPEPSSGELVDVHGADGEFLGRGYYNPRSQIRIRVLTFRKETVDTGFFVRRFTEAAKWRARFLDNETTAFRVCNSEGDFFPGLIVDRYNDFLVVQFQTAGIEVFRNEITDALVEVFSPKGIFEKSEGGYRKEEGLDQVSGSLYGAEPDEPVEIVEHGLKFLVDIRSGQKTGFFLDQRNARHIARQCAEGRTALNCFGYSGAFTVAMLAGGAERVITVDTSSNALDLAKSNVERNGFAVNDEDFVEADVFQFLRSFDGVPDLVVLDPPAFAKSRASLQRASRGYKDINFNAMRMMPEDSLLFTFSCSGHVSPDLFQKIIFAAATDAGRGAQILQRFGNGFDHPINIYHPEGEYLTGALCRISNNF